MINLREFLHVLKQRNLLKVIEEEVDPYLELAEIHRRVIETEGPALLFKNVKNSHFPVVTNLFGTTERMELAFPSKPEKLVESLAQLISKEPLPPSLKTLWKYRTQLRKVFRIGTKKVRQAPVLQHKMIEPDLEQLPMTKSWQMDGGCFLTLPLVLTHSPNGGRPNLGMYRIHRYDKRRTGLHFQIGKGGGFHYAQAESQKEPLPVSIFLGGPPALILSAIAPLPENVPELILASVLQDQKLALTQVEEFPHPIISECEFALLGKAQPYERALEGPFGDHYGYYSLAHEFPVFHCEHVYHRKDAIFPATVVGKPRQEDFFIGDYLQKLLAPLFPLVMPQVADLWSFGETGFHSLAAAIVKERYERECMVSAFRILGEGQLSLTKFLILTDQQINIRNIKSVLESVLERFKPETDLFIFSNLSLDTLDYTGPELNKGSKGVMLGIGNPIRKLPEHIEGPLPQPIEEAVVFCKGCLVLQTPSYALFKDINYITQLDFLQQWPLVILVDDAAKATRTNSDFLWTVFTRFEPAADIYSKRCSIHRHHLVYEGPIFIDARMKPSYPEELECDDATRALVDKKWHKYFS